MYHNNNAYIETKYTHYLSKNQGFLLQFFENLCFLSKIHRPMVWKKPIDRQTDEFLSATKVIINEYMLTLRWLKDDSSITPDIAKELCQ